MSTETFAGVEELQTDGEVDKRLKIHLPVRQQVSVSSLGSRRSSLIRQSARPGYTWCSGKWSP